MRGDTIGIKSGWSSVIARTAIKHDLPPWCMIMRGGGGRRGAYTLRIHGYDGVVDMRAVCTTLATLTGCPIRWVDKEKEEQEVVVAD